MNGESIIVWEQTHLSFVWTTMKTEAAAALALTSVSGASVALRKPEPTPSRDIFAVGNVAVDDADDDEGKMVRAPKE